MADDAWGGSGNSIASGMPSDPWAGSGASTATEHPGLLSRIGSQVGDFFSTASHAMNPENLMSQIPTSWEDLKNKWQAEKEDLRAHGQGAANQFQQGNVGAGVSTLMNADPVIGQPTGQAADYLRQNEYGKAAGTLAPYLIPGAATPEALDSAAAAKAAVKQRVADVPAIAAEHINNANPKVVKAATMLGLGVPAYAVGESVLHHIVPGVGGIGLSYMTRGAGSQLGDALLDWAKKYKEEPATPPAGPPAMSVSQRAPVPTGVQYTGTTGATIPIGESGTVGGTPVNAPAPIAPSGPSPQLLKSIAQATGGKGDVQKILESMQASGYVDPGTGKPVVAPRTTVAPSPTQPGPVSGPTTPTQTPYSGNVAEHEWRTAGTNNDYPVKLITDQGVRAHASQYGMTPDQAEADLVQQGYTPDTRRNYMNSMMGHAKAIWGKEAAEPEVYKLFQNDGIRNVSEASPDEVLNVYKKVLDMEGAMPQGWQKYVDYRKEASPQAKGSANIHATPVFNMQTNP